MKKRIIFTIINMSIGGTEKALLNMLAVIPKDKYEITILMLEKKGGFLSSIPNHVHIESLDGYSKIKDVINLPPREVLSNFLENGRIFIAIYLVFLYLITKMVKERSSLFRYLLKSLPEAQNEYDLAVAYAGPMDFISYFVAKKINAKRKIQWIHFDVRKIGFNIHFAKKYYKHFHKIFTVSNEGKDILTKKLPSFKDKIESFPNLTPRELVIKMADEGMGFTDGFSGLRILTVGRLSQEKGQDITIPVLARLKEDGYNIRWYCIGEGIARKDYEKLIKDYGFEDDYILLGSHANPYPYMKQCNIYVQPSRHEGYCITLAEARCFDNPIVTTSFTGAHEQIYDEQTGLVVEFNEEQLYQAIKRLCDDDILRLKIKNNLQSWAHPQINHLNKLLAVVEG